MGVLALFWVDRFDALFQERIRCFGGWALGLPKDLAARVNKQDVGIVRVVVVDQAAPGRFVVEEREEVRPAAIGDGGLDASLHEAAQQSS